jgi:hypothetical protein
VSLKIFKSQVATIYISKYDLTDPELVLKLFPNLLLSATDGFPKYSLNGRKWSYAFNAR